MRIILLSLFIHLTLFADFNATKKEIDNFRKVVTLGYYGALNNLDCYLTDYNDTNRSNYKEISKHKLQIIISAKDISKDSAKLALRLRGKIVLPRLKEKFELTFSQNDDEQIDNQNINSGYDDVIDDSKLHVGLKYYLYKEKKSKAYGKLSFKLRSPFGLYAKIGIDKSYLHKDFETLFNHGLYYYINDNKFAASSAVSFFKPITIDWWIGQQNRLYWEPEDGIYLSHNLTLYQILDLNNRIFYKTSYTTAYDDIDHLQQDSFGCSIGYFHRFNKWFFIELIPEFKKRRSNQYKPENVVTLNFGMLLSR
ncbi:MAG: hypothetical protein K0U47_08610 [Epsilonproteobacteria bacterium]|nr:hypothetical protein [Campylobacterota bacterium]